MLVPEKAATSESENKKAKTMTKQYLEKSRIGLSIDYDFFLTDGNLEKEFWSQLEKRSLKPRDVIYDNDHKNAYYFFKPLELDILIHFDNHSDCYNKNLSTVTTENWLLKLMQVKPSLKVIWIQHKILANEGTECRSVIRSKNWIEPPFCFKELIWEYDRETKEHFLEANSPQMNTLLEPWNQLDKTLKIVGIKNPNVLGCYVSRSPYWTKDRTSDDFELFIKDSKAKVQERKQEA
jgi:hypothetical protein